VFLVENLDWCVAVFKCKADGARDVVVDFYSFVDGMFGVRDLYFLIRDRVDDEVVFNFRVLVEREQMEVVKSKMRYSLKRIFSTGSFSINPRRNSPLHKYAAWQPDERSTKFGEKKLSLFCRLLSQLSRFVVDMARNDYFGSEERAELAHVTSWMLGCTECGLLSAEAMQVGYYDRIEDRYRMYLKQRF
jgi:hypothetical protein